LSVKGVTKTHINEIEFQITNTLNQNFRLFKNRTKNESEEESTSCDDAQILYRLASNQENTEFFKNQYDEPYVAVRVGKDRHLETMPLLSNKYERYLIRLFCKSNWGKIIGKDAVSRALNLLAANTIFDGKTVPLQIRVAWGKTENKARQDCIYYDLTDSRWRIVEIAQVGWRVIDGADMDVPILFKRHNQTIQKEPDRIYNPDVMDRFLDLTNVKSANQRQLLKVYIISLLIPDIDHVILTTYGPKGAAKTFLLWLIKTLLDPSKPALLTLIGNLSEFIQQVNHTYLAFYDNVKYIPYWQSDEICKTVTGIGHTKRKLYTDDEDIVYEHRRCIAINGIDVALVEPDAMDRSLFIELPEIDYDNIRAKEDLIQEFQAIRPQLLGFIFDILVKAMRIKNTLQLQRHSRMADFTEWGEAISRALGYDKMSFVNAYLQNRNEQNIVAINENIVGRIFVDFYKNYEMLHIDDPKFVGSPEELQREIVAYAESTDVDTDNRQFPHFSNVLIKKLNAIKSNLKEAYGIVVQVSRDTHNNSVVSIFRSNIRLDMKNISKINVVNNYYGKFVQRQHIQNNQNTMTQTSVIPEVVSGTSEPPEESKTINDASGGTEVPEVNSVVTLPETIRRNNEISPNDTHYIVLKEILEIIREKNGSEISFIAAIECACARNKSVRNYLGDDLTFKDNQKVCDLREIIRHDKPQITLRWQGNTSLK